MGKVHEMPVKGYIYKYIEPLLDAAGVYVHPKRLIHAHTNTIKAREWLDKNRHSKYKVKVEISHTSITVLYGLYTDLHREFRQRMYEVMSFAELTGGNVWQAMVVHLNKYGITEEEYSYHSAYRDYQRNKSKFKEPKLRGKKPNPTAPAGRQLDLFCH